MGALFVLVAFCALVALLLRTLTRLHVANDDIRWLADSTDISVEEGVVYSRYLARHRLHRLVGGALGVVIAVVVGIRLYSQVSIGFANSPLADTLFCGVAGVVVGALSAETYRLVEPRTSVRSASLTARSAPAQPRVVHAARLLTAVALAVGVLAGIGSDDLAPLLVSIAGAAVVAVAELTRQAVVTRQRPVLSDAAHQVDDRLRRFATGAVAWLQLAAGSLALGWTIASASPDDMSDALTVLVAVLTLTCLVVAVVALRKAAPRPPRRLRVAA